MSDILKGGGVYFLFTNENYNEKKIDFPTTTKVNRYIIDYTVNQKY